MLPDIAHLVYLYAIYPVYKPIEQVKFIFDDSIDDIIKLCSIICKNPRAIRYIKKFNFSSDHHAWIQLLQNPAIEVVSIIALYPNKKELSHIFANSNPEVVNQVLDTNPNFSQEINSEHVIYFASCPCDLTTKITLGSIKENPSDAIIEELCKNPNPLAVEYLLDSFDELVKNFSLVCSLASNTNIKILEKLDKYLETCEFAKRCRVISLLSSNPSAISILKKYPELINLSNLARNPSLDAYELFIQFNYMDILAYFDYFHQIYDDNLVNNPNPKMFQIYWDEIYPNNDKLIEYDTYLDNPLFFELDRKSTIKLINHIFNHLKAS